MVLAKSEAAASDVPTAEGAASACEVGERTFRGDALIEVDGLSFTYPSGLTAISDLSLSIERGKSIAIVGPSGCGKSTLLRLLGGLHQATEGTVQTYFLPAKERQPVSMVFQEDTLLPWLTVRKNVALYYRLHPRRETRRATDELAIQLLRMVGLEDFADAYPKELSGGMRRRVAFIAGVAPNPQLLLLDEPFSSVDEPTRVQIHQQVRDIVRDSEMTTILVTHDLAEAISLTDEVHILTARPSRLISSHEVCLGRRHDLLELRNTPEFLALYGVLWKDLSLQIRNSASSDHAAGGS